MEDKRHISWLNICKSLIKRHLQHEAADWSQTQNYFNTCWSKLSWVRSNLLVTAGCWSTESAMAGTRNATEVIARDRVKVNGGGSDSVFFFFFVTWSIFPGPRLPSWPKASLHPTLRLEEKQSNLRKQRSCGITWVHRSYFLGLATFLQKKKKPAHNQPQQLPFPSHPFIVCFAKFEIGGMENAAKTRELCLSKRAYHSHHTFLIRTLLEFKMLNWDSQVFKGEEGADSAVGDKWNVSDVPLPTPLQEDFT